MERTIPDKEWIHASALRKLEHAGGGGGNVTGPEFEENGEQKKTDGNKSWASSCTFRARNRFTAMI